MKRARPFLVALLFSVGCGENAGTTEALAPWAITPFPDLPPNAVDVPAARKQLGRLLFFDPILSIDGETACATCHSEHWGMGDALPLSVGHGGGIIAGPLREGPNVLRRNAQALWNLAFRADLFWDGRTATLEEQALMPLLEQKELDRPPEDVVVDLASIEEYVDLFAEAFPDDPRVTVENMASALAALQRSFVSSRSLYDARLEGDMGAMSSDMVSGMFRFADFGCPSCHEPPLFETPRYANRNVPPVEGIEDEGRYEVTGDEADRGKYRVPTMRNVFFSNPYFHNGSVAKLSDAVEHELAQGELAYTEEDVRLITAFIGQALRDQSREPDRPDTVPSGLQVPLDGTAIQR